MAATVDKRKAGRTLMMRNATKRALVVIFSLLNGAAILFALVFLAGSAPAGVTAQNGGTETPLPLFALPDARTNRAYTSGSMAMLSEGRTLIAVNTINDTVSIAVPSQGNMISEIRVGRDPRSVAVTSDDTRAVITNRVDSTLSVIDIREARVINTIPVDGVFPYGIVIGDGDGEIAYVSLLGSDAVALIDLASGAEIARISTPPAPAGLALWGEFLYVTHFWTGELTLIYLPQRRVIQTVTMGAPISVSQAVEIDISRGLAYLPGSRTYAENPTLTYETAVLPTVNVVDLRGNAMQRGGRVALDTADRPVNMPFAAALDRFTQKLYVANAGSDSISVIDLNTGEARAHINVGSNPRAILLNRDYTLLYVHNALDATITTITTSDLEIVSTLPISNLTVSVDVLLGAQLFYGATDPRMSRDNWLSCAVCHYDGMSDGRVWAGFGAGGRNTPLLYALPETPPYRWSGTWVELADAEYKIRSLLGGTGLIDSAFPPLPEELHDPLNESDLDLLTAYLITLAPPSPEVNAPEALIARGAEVFEEQNCVSCHVGTVGTDLRAYDVGTGGEFDTPSLRWLAWSAPYLHDGRALTLRDVFLLPGAHQLVFDVSLADIDALVAYLLTLPPG